MPGRGLRIRRRHAGGIEKAEATGDMRMAALARVHLGRVFPRSTGRRSPRTARCRGAFHRYVGGGEQAALGSACSPRSTRWTRTPARRSTRHGPRQARTRDDAPSRSSPWTPSLASPHAGDHGPPPSSGRGRPAHGRRLPLHQRAGPGCRSSTPRLTRSRAPKLSPAGDLQRPPQPGELGAAFVQHDEGRAVRPSRSRSRRSVPGPAPRRAAGTTTPRPGRAAPPGRSPIVPMGIDFWANTSRPCAATPVSEREDQHVGPPGAAQAEHVAFGDRQRQHGDRRDRADRRHERGDIHVAGGSAGSRRRTRPKNMASTPNTLPYSDASPLAGALNSTMATPPNATSANTSATG